MLLIIIVYVAYVIIHNLAMRARIAAHQRKMKESLP